MFGRGKTSPADELYRGQESRNGDYGQAYEYRTITGFGAEAFDLELNALAAVGWEPVGFHVSSGGSSTAFYKCLRRALKR